MDTDRKTAEILDFVMAERARSVSDREWRHRLAGYGYALRDRSGAVWLTTLPGERDICTVEA